MLYLSQILNKQLYFKDKSYGKVIDFTVNDNESMPAISKIVIKHEGKKSVIDADLVAFSDGKWILKSDNIPYLPYDHKDFYIAEDLLDKQVIDINGKRLVRVNDIVLKQNDTLRVEAIDIGFSGLLRRLGIEGMVVGLKTITLPWSFIEAFDYQTGNVKIKLAQSSLNTLHPAEIADILEDAGTKERIGVVQALDAQKAASAIEEANEETQSAILEQVPSSHLKSIVEKMHVSEIVDVFHQLNPFTSSQILKSLSSEKAGKVKKLLIFADDVAGGMMDVNFYSENGDKIIAQVQETLLASKRKPEAIIVVDTEGKLQGTFSTKNLLYTNSGLLLKDAMTQRVYVDEDTPFSKILRLFAEYNLRILPVVDTQKKVIGVITIDNMLAHIQEDEEREDAI